MKSWIVAFVACLLLASGSAAMAQEARGTLQGKVSDASGAVVPGATVEVTNIATGVTTPTTSNEEGNYRVPFLNPGTYRVTVTLDGFSKFASQNIELHVAEVLILDATLQPGQITDEVTVSAATTAVDSNSAGLGQVVDARRISELPIREGTAVELVILAPGVQNTTDLRSRKAAFNNGLSQWSSDGAGEKRNDFTIDGVANVAADRVAYSPPSAAVEEFKIQTATYDAAVGNAMGATVNLVTKSGTNNLRGQVYEWYRGDKLDSGNYFDEKAGRPKRDYKDNRFGAAVGGPITRGRTFYFANVEANPFEVPQPVTLSVPTAKMRTGDFSDLLALGSQYQLYDPATTRPHPTQAGRFIRDPFPGNIIPSQPHQPGRAEDPRLLPAAERAGDVGRREQLHQPDRGRVRDLLHGDHAHRSQPVGSAPDLRPLQLGLLGRGEGRSLRQPLDRHLPQSEEPGVRDRRRLHGEEQPADEHPRRLHPAIVPRAAAQPGLRSRLARLRQLARLAGAVRRGDVSQRDLRRVSGVQPVGVRRRVLHHRRLQRDRQHDLAGRQPQHEVRHRVSPLRRKLQPVPDRRLADDRIQHELDARSARQLGGGASRSGLRLVPARPANRRLDEPGGRVHASRAASLGCTRTTTGASATTSPSTSGCGGRSKRH